MNTEQRQRIRKLFIEALRLSTSDRAALLDERCAGDTALRAEVESLLAHDAQVAPGFLQPPEPDPGIRRTAAEVEDGSLVGRQVGHYTIKDVIATGGMGTVYLAEQARPRRNVAIKMMRAGLGSRVAVRRFEYESEVLARLRHPNIAQVYEAGTHPASRARSDTASWARSDAASRAVPRPGPGLEDEPARSVPYFVMEYVPDARTITGYAAEKQLPTRERLALFATVCEAVHHGHQKGIIHRDLKPGNILVDAEGRVKIIDFGVARATDSDVAVTTMGTDVGQLIGTLQYMSPEQCDADPHDLDTRTDVYSLGVLLYELLTGALPYDVSSRSIYQATRAIKEEPPRRPSAVRGAGVCGTGVSPVNRDVETIVLKALEKDRRKRYVSAAGLGFDIRRYLAGEPITARPPTAWTRFCHVVSRHPVAATTAMCLAIAVLTLVATAASVWFMNERPHQIVRYRNGVAMDPHDYSSAANEARLLSVGGNILKTWGGEARSIISAELVDRPEEFGGGWLALIGYGPSEAGPYRKTLCAYEIGGNREAPIWTKRVETEDILPHLRKNRAYSGDQFNVTSNTLIADVFPGPEHPGVEVVAVFAHFNSQRVIRIYDLDEKLLYQVWHDGACQRPHWMAKARLLVFASDNAMGNWDRHGNLVGSDLNPLVVFALRPEPGFIDKSDDYLPSKAGADPLSPVWYKCLRLGEREAPVTRNDIAGHGLVRPFNHDPGRFVQLNVVASREAGMGSGWILDEFGNEANCGQEKCNHTGCKRQVGDPYKINRKLKPGDPRKLDVPNPEDFHLGPMPPPAAVPAAKPPL